MERLYLVGMLLHFVRRRRRESGRRGGGGDETRRGARIEKWLDLDLWVVIGA